MPVNVRPVDPLQHDARIVDEKGFPTVYFIRQWIASRQINLTVDDVTLSIEEIDAILLELQEDVLAAYSAAVAAQVDADALEARQIIAGVGLAGGGNLTVDRTLDLEDTAVSPGVYGSATHTPQITVDQQGRITNVVEVLIVP